MFATRLIASVMVVLGLMVPAQAQERQVLGWGRFVSNDATGDGQDRWRTGSYSLSLLRGPEWSGALPAQPGVILEYRLRAEAIAPESLTKANPADRPYVGALSFGLHSHFDVTRCADETRSKPHPAMLEEILRFYDLEPTEAVMIGDTTFDLEMAQRIGMPSIGVRWGSHDDEALGRFAPRAIVGSVAELRRELGRLSLDWSPAP